MCMELLMFSMALSQIFSQLSILNFFFCVYNNTILLIQAKYLC